MTAEVETGLHAILERPYIITMSQVFVVNIESIFINIFLPKSKPILVVVLYRPSDKPGFKEHFNNSLKESNICNIQECCLLGYFSVNLLSKMLLKKHYSDSYSQVSSTKKIHRSLLF